MDLLLRNVDSCLFPDEIRDMAKDLVDRLLEAIEKLETENSDLKEELKEANQQIQDLQGTISGLETEIVNLKEELSK